MPRFIQYSFSYGEISPSLEFRSDVEGYIQAAQRIENFIIDYRGGLVFRPGTLFVGPLRSTPVSLFSFRLFGDQDKSFLLVFTDGALEFVIDRGFQLDTPVTSNGVSADYTLFPSTWGCQPGDMVVYGSQHLRVDEVVAGTPDNQVKLRDLSGSVVTIPAGESIEPRTVVRTPWPASAVRELQLIRHKNEAIILHHSTHPKLLRFEPSGTWTFEDVNFAKFRAVVRISSLDAKDGTSASQDHEYDCWYSYRVAAVDADGNESPAGPPVAIKRTAMSQVAARAVEIKWNPVPGAVEYIIYRTRELTAVDTAVGKKIPPFGDEHGFIGRTSSTVFVDENTTPDFTKVPREPGNPFARKTIETIFISNSGSGYGEDPATNPVVHAPEISADLAAGGSTLIGFGVINHDGGIDNVILIDLPEGLADPPNVYVSAYDGGGSGVQFDVTLTPDTGLFPRTGIFYNQRLLLSGQDADPQTVHGSNVGEPFNFDSSTPPLDSDTFSHRIVMGGYDPIVSMAEMNGSVILGTPVGVWSMSGGGPKNVLGPSSVGVSSQTFTGVSDLGLLRVETGLCFMSHNRRALYALQYNPVSDAFSVEELTLFASHIFKDHTATSLVYVPRPFSTIQAVRDDGQIASFTYFPPQKIFAWSRLTTQGRFETIGALILADSTETYVVADRDGIPVLEVFASLSDPAERHHRFDCGFIRRGTRVDEEISWTERTVSTTYNLSVGDGVLLPDGGLGIIQPDGSVLWAIRPKVSKGQETWFEHIPPVTSVSGLDWYAGQRISCTIDGKPSELDVDQNGVAVLPETGHLVCVGLPYEGRIETLPIDLVEQPVRAVHRRHVQATIRLDDRSSGFGLEVGPEADRLTPVKTLEDSLVAETVPFQWGRLESLHIRYAGKRPLTILGVIIDVSFGSS